MLDDEVFVEIEGRAKALLARYGRPDREFAELGMITTIVGDYELTGMVIPKPYVTVRRKDSPYTEFDSRPCKYGITQSQSGWMKMLNTLRRAMVLDDLARA